MKIEVNHKPPSGEHTQSVTTAMLLATDRCDQCGAQAIMRMKRGTTVLLFCLHDHRANRDALTLAGWSLNVDDSATLVKS